MWANRQHTEKSERSIQTVNQRARFMVHSTPYIWIPNLVIARLVMGALKCLNALPSKTVVSGTLIPKEIIEGRPSPDCRNLTLNMVEYLQL